MNNVSYIKIGVFRRQNIEKYSFNFSFKFMFAAAPETFWVRKAISSSSVSKNGEGYTPETSAGKNGTSVHIKNM